MKIDLQIFLNCAHLFCFILIYRYLHFADNKHLSTTDKAFKIRPIFNLLNSRFLQWGICDENLAVDETMVAYYGRSSLKQFIRGKPIRFGFKKWTLAGSSGYCYHSDLYLGRDSKNERGQKPLGSHVVETLVSNCITSPNSHTIFFDNFFTSLDLLTHLADNGLRATGTVRSNRTGKAPLETDKELKKKGRGHCDSRFHVGKEILVAKWHDNACVTIATNYDSTEPLSTIKRRSKSGIVTVPQPHLISSYNQSMGGVDQFDQHVAAYRVVIRSKKWYWTLFTHALDSSVVNSWLVYKSSAHATTTQLDFKRKLALVYLQRATGKSSVHLFLLINHICLQRYVHFFSLPPTSNIASHCFRANPVRQRWTFNNITGRSKALCISWVQIQTSYFLC
jgi:hypothetical protein